MSVDLLLVSLGTTRGLRVADTAFLEQVRAGGASAEAVAVRLGALDRLRRGYPVNDLVEAAAARRSLGAALERRPRAVVFSSITAALLAPRLDVGYAVRLDSPAVLNRPGLRNRLLHVSERRALGGARLVLPWSRAALAALPAGSDRAVVLPPPIVPSGPPARSRERVAVAYVPDPKAKGLSLLCAAWTQAAVADARLVVFGIDAAAARRHLARFGPGEPQGVEWRGLVPAAQFRQRLRESLVFVHSARWEDFGQAPLEALADGALVATVPSGGAYEALAIARELDPRLAASSLDPGGLAGAVRAAFGYEQDAARAYRMHAAGLLAAYSPDALERTVRDEVLPPLLG
jgi:hypothetical protein